MKPLFIPLKTAYFEAFADGTKTVEYRAYGPRWNERICVPGRPATISHGYSGNRITATISQFETLILQQAPAPAQQLFPHAHLIAAIHLTIAQDALESACQRRQARADHQLRSQGTSLL